MLVWIIFLRLATKWLTFMPISGAIPGCSSWLAPWLTSVLHPTYTSTLQVSRKAEIRLYSSLFVCVCVCLCTCVPLVWACVEDKGQCLDVICCFFNLFFRNKGSHWTYSLLSVQAWLADQWVPGTSLSLLSLPPCYGCTRPHRLPHGLWGSEFSCLHSNHFLL